MRIVSVVLWLALGGAILAGCSGSEEEPTFATTNGNEVAEAMLPEARVFPGAGWRVLPADEEDDDNDGCVGLDGAFDGLDDDVQAKLDEPAGTAAREYELDGSNEEIPIPVSIELETEVHEDRDALKEGIKALDTLLHSPEFEQCMRDAMEAGASEGGEGTSVEVTVSNASAAVPRDGSGLGLDAKISLAGVTAEMRLEMYAWRIGNAAAFVFISGSKQDVTDEFVRNVLERIDGAAVIAAKKE